MRISRKCHFQVTWATTVPVDVLIMWRCQVICWSNGNCHFRHIFFPVFFSMVRMIPYATSLLSRNVRRHSTNAHASSMIITIHREVAFWWQISPKFVHKGLINSRWALGQIMARQAETSWAVSYIPTDTRHNNNFIITSKQRCYVVST